MRIPFRASGEDASSWAERHFSGARMGDRRRGSRLKKLAAAWASYPGQSVPAMLETRYDIKAAYAFFDRPEATPEEIQAGHRQLTRQGASEAGVTALLIEDTSTLSWAGHAPVRGLGPLGLGRAGLQGFLLHSVLAVKWGAPDAGSRGRRPPLEVLGLIDQQYYVRRPRPGIKPAGDTRAHTRREFESQLWDRTLGRIGAPEAGARWIRVADRGADIYEFLRDTGQAGLSYVVRAAHDRRLEEEQGRASRKLFQVAREAPWLGEFMLDLRERPGQPARRARLGVAAAEVRLRSTMRPGRRPGQLPCVPCTVVRIAEIQAPATAPPLEWMLLTDASVQSFEQGREVALQYASRWLIEEFHKALKTGLRAEALQLETAERLFAAIAILSVVALRLIDLRERVRLEPEAPAEASGLDEVELRVLRVRLKRPVLTVREVALGLGRLGGHMNRKSDGPPGWITLWRGSQKLTLLVQGFRLAQSLSRFGE